MANDTIYRLYKYRSLSSHHAPGKKSPRYYTERLVRHRKLYYGRPSLLNDPFDCHWSLSAEGSNLDRLSERVAHGEQFMNDRTDSSFAVFCLAQEPDNLLMWAHYEGSRQSYCQFLWMRAS